MRGAMFQNDSNYIQIYRDLILDPSFVGLPPSYRCVLFSLLANACYTPWQQDDHGKLIDLLPGQFMCTIRHLADISNVGKNDAERALKKFVEMKIVRLEVRHKKTIVTIVYGIRLKNGETTKETRKRQDRDTKEEDLSSSGKEDKKMKNEKEEIPPQTKKEEITTTTNTEKNGGGGFSETVILMNLKGEEVKATESEIYRHFLKFEYPTEIISQGIREIKLYKTPVSNILKLLETICLRLFKASQEPVIKPTKKQKPVLEDIPKTESKGSKIDLQKLKEKFK